MTKVSIVGQGRIGQYLATVMTEPVQFLKILQRPVNGSVVFLALGEKDTIQWLYAHQMFRGFVITNCSVKSRVAAHAEKLKMLVFHLHIMFNPVFQRTGPILLVDSIGSTSIVSKLQQLLGMPITYTKGQCVACHDGVMSIQQKRFQQDVMRIGDYLREVPVTMRTASATKFLELYERVRSLGPEVLAEIQGNPLNGKHDEKNFDWRKSIRVPAKRKAKR